MNYFIDKNIKNTKRVFPMQKRAGYLRLDMNENSEGLPKEFIAKVLNEITPEFLAMYPEPDRFMNKYAEYVGMSYNNILLTNGSDMAIRYILETFGEPGKEVVTVTPSFEMYRVNCNVLGLKNIPVPYDTDLKISINKIIKAINDDTRIVVLVNPNNPMGNVYSNEEIKLIIQRASDVGAIVIVDEAYHYFYKGTFVNEVLNYDNVIVLRTFSKLLSLAACRLGIIISNSKLISYIRNTRLTFDVNSIALLFAEKIFDSPLIIEQLIKRESRGKKYLINILEKNNYKYIKSKANFLLIRPKYYASSEIEEKLRKNKKILVHAYKNELLKDYFRVSIGSEKLMSIFLEAFFDIDKIQDSRGS